MRGKKRKMLYRLFLASCAMQHMLPTKSGWNHYKKRMKQYEHQATNN